VTCDHQHDSKRSRKVDEDDAVSVNGRIRGPAVSIVHSSTFSVLRSCSHSTCQEHQTRTSNPEPNLPACALRRGLAAALAEAGT
jgi:hypothetical protein